MRYARLLFFLLGIALLVLLARRAGVQDSVRILGALDWWFVALAAVSYLGVNAARVIRLSLILGGRVRNDEFFSLIFIQNFFNVFLSFSGDVAYVSMLHKKKAVSLGENISSLAVVKVLDLTALAACFFLSLFWVSVPVALRAALFFLLAVAALAGAALAWFGIPRASAGRLVRYLGVRPRVLNVFRDIADGFSVLKDRGLMPGILGATAVNWVLTFLAGFSLLHSAGIAARFGEAMFAYTFPIVASLTPLFVFGGLGSYEASLASGLTLIGIAAGRAIAASIAIHVVELVFVTACGAAGALLGAGYFSRRRGV